MQNIEQKIWEVCSEIQPKTYEEIHLELKTDSPRIFLSLVIAKGLEMIRDGSLIRSKDGSRRLLRGTKPKRA